MSDPVTFASITPNIGLPMLIAGQAQKEFFVNQAFGVLDALLGRRVLASLSEPPAALEGDCYRVTALATQAWAGCEDHLAVLVGGDWHFVAPSEGMSVFDAAAGHALVFRSGWKSAVAPAAPTGGTVVDSEARAAILQLVQSLRVIGSLA